MKIFRVAGDNRCGCCLSYANLYVLAETQKEADKIYKNDSTEGLCGDCMFELVLDGKYEITDERHNTGEKK